MWMDNFFSPLFQLIIYLFLMGWTLFFTYWILKKIFHNFGLWWKYSFRRKSYDTEDIKWCMDVINEGMTQIDAKKTLLLKNYPKKRVNEMLYIYNKVLREMKGGKK